MGHCSPNSSIEFVFFGPLTYYVTLILEFLDTHPPPATNSKLPTHPPPIKNFNRVFFCFLNSVFIISFLASKQDCQIDFRREAQFILQKAKLALVKQNVLNIELFTKCDITLQGQPTHPLSHKSKYPPTPIFVT